MYLHVHVYIIEPLQVRQIQYPYKILIEPLQLCILRLLQCFTKLISWFLCNLEDLRALYTIEPSLRLGFYTEPFNLLNHIETS